MAPTLRGARLPSPRVLAALVLALAATGAYAQGKCTATGAMAGEKFSLANCVAAYYADTNSVTIWFSESPIAAKEAEAFQASAYADGAPGGKPRTMIVAAFCPGGGKPAAASAAVKSLDLSMTHAKSPLAGAQWVVESPRDFKVESLAGEVKPGGRLAGRIAGGRASDGRPYAWDLTFDVTLPPTEAASGVGCAR